MKSYLIIVSVLMSATGCGMQLDPFGRPPASPQPHASPSPLPSSAPYDTNPSPALSRPIFYDGSTLNVPGISFVRTAAGANTFYYLPTALQTVRRNRLGGRNDRGGRDIIDESPVQHRIALDPDGNQHSMYNLQLRLTRPSDIAILMAEQEIDHREDGRNTQIIGPLPGIRVEAVPTPLSSVSRIHRIEIDPGIQVAVGYPTNEGTIHLEISVPLSHEPEFALSLLQGRAQIPMNFFIRAEAAGIIQASDRIYPGLTDGVFRIWASVSVWFPRSRLDPSIQIPAHTEDLL